jgi:hypothetical protein
MKKALPRLSQKERKGANSLGGEAGARGGTERLCKEKMGWEHSFTNITGLVLQRHLSGMPRAQVLRVDGWGMCVGGQVSG